MNRGEPYEVALTRTARRALAERVSVDVAVAASEFIAGLLADNPCRVGKELNAPYEGVWSARPMREWRILYVIDPEQRLVVVRDVARRRYVYRPS